MTYDELKSLLARFHIRPDKRLGQNFLLSDKALEEIVDAAELKPDDTVLEIGPGLGVLTHRLGERAGLVLAVEKDFKLATALRKIFKNKKNIKVIRDDALFLDLPVILRYPEGSRDSSASTPQNDKVVNYKVVANIPYYITGKLLQNFLTPTSSPPYQGGEREGVKGRPSLMVLLLQKEVAQRIVAKPGEMSILSVSVQFYADPEIISVVPRAEFYPAPEVDSAVVRLRVYPHTTTRFGVGVDEKKFFQLVKIGFAGKRKQLHNNLASGFGKDRDYKKILEEIGQNPLARAQDLSMEEWEKLYKKLKVES